MAVSKHVLIRRANFAIMQQRGWTVGTVVRHKATGHLVTIGTRCISGIHHNESFWVMMNSQRYSWPVGKIVEECEEI